MEPPLNGKPWSVDKHGAGELRGRLRRLSRRGFAWGGVAALAGFVGWRWLVTRSQEDGLPWPLRRVLEFDEQLARGLFCASSRSPEFPRSAARMPRVNGTIGLESVLDLSAWRLQVVGAAGERANRSFTLDEIKALPRVEMTTELRCIEGWSEVVHWAVRGYSTWPPSPDWRPAAAGPPIRSARPTTCSATPRWRRPTASITSGSTWPAPSIPRPCSATR